MPAYHSMRNNGPILPNGVELPDNASIDAVHISRDNSKSTYIHLLSRSGVKETISCTQISRRMCRVQLEGYRPFVPSSHFAAYNAENSRKISCPNCEQLIDPCMIQVHRLIDCVKKHKEEARCELCGHNMLYTNLERHMETHGPKRYMCSCCGRKFHRSDYFQDHMNNPSACQIYLSELSSSIINAQGEDGINLEDPRYNCFIPFHPGI